MSERAKERWERDRCPMIAPLKKWDVVRLAADPEQIGYVMEVYRTDGTVLVRWDCGPATYEDPSKLVPYQDSDRPTARPVASELDAVQRVVVAALLERAAYLAADRARLLDPDDLWEAFGGPFLDRIQEVLAPGSVTEESYA